MRGGKPVSVDRLTPLVGSVALVCLLALPALGQVGWDDAVWTKHSQYQAVDSSGNTTYNATDAIRMWGVVINDPADMLNSTFNSSPPPPAMWQTYIQYQSDLGGATLPAGAPTDDFGGTALWMGQVYAWATGTNYDEPTWNSEMDRVNFPVDVGTGQPVTESLRPGDLVEVLGRAPGLFWAGKYNINEAHWTDPSVDFDIRILARDVPLEIADIVLSDVKDDGSQGGTFNDFRFDASRQTGAEHYQARLVNVEGVSVMDPENWAPNQTVTVQDSSGLTLPMLLGLDPAFGTTAPTGTFDVVGIFDQEDEPPGPFTNNYRLWVMDASQFDDPQGVPEPSSLLLSLCGLATVAGLVRRRRQR